MGGVQQHREPRGDCRGEEGPANGLSRGGWLPRQRNHPCTVVHDMRKTSPADRGSQGPPDTSTQPGGSTGNRGSSTKPEQRGVGVGGRRTTKKSPWIGLYLDNGEAREDFAPRTNLIRLTLVRTLLKIIRQKMNLQVARGRLHHPWTKQ